MQKSHSSFKSRGGCLLAAILLGGCLIVLAVFTWPILMMVWFFCTGGFQPADSKPPLDNEGLRLRIVSGKHWPCLGTPREHRLFDITAEEATRLVETLRPITSAKVGHLPPEKVDYVLSYQAGMNPTVFHVHLAEGHLVFAERRYLYEGGDAKAFKRVADTIASANPGKPGMILDSIAYPASGTETR